MYENWIYLESEYDRSRIFDISPNSEVECIKYNVLDFCNYLLVAANFPFDNNRVLIFVNSKLLWSINGKRPLHLNLWLRRKFSEIKFGGRSLSRRSFSALNGLGFKVKLVIVHSDLYNFSSLHLLCRCLNFHKYICGILLCQNICSAAASLSS